MVVEVAVGKGALTALIKVAESIWSTVLKLVRKGKTADEIKAEVRKLLMGEPIPFDIDRMIESAEELLGLNHPDVATLKRMVRDERTTTAERSKAGRVMYHRPMKAAAKKAAAKPAKRAAKKAAKKPAARKPAKKAARKSAAKKPARKA